MFLTGRRTRALIVSNRIESVWDVNVKPLESLRLPATETSSKRPPFCFFVRNVEKLCRVMYFAVFSILLLNFVVTLCYHESVW